MFGCSFSKDATSSSHCVRCEAAVVGGSQLTVMVVGALTSFAGAELAAGLAGVLAAAGALVAAGAAAEELAAALGAVLLGALALDLLLEQPATVTTAATASSAINLWCFIERSSWKVGPGRRSPRQSRRHRQQRRPCVRTRLARTGARRPCQLSCTEGTDTDA